MFIIAVAGKQFPVNPEFHHTARLLPWQVWKQKRQIQFAGETPVEVFTA